jgi:hypothetical protein
MKKYIVLKEFADKDNFAKRYPLGSSLPSGFSEERLENIVNAGLAKVVDEKPTEKLTEPNKLVTDIDLTEKVVDLLPSIKVFTDAEKLKQYLETEKAAEKPRETIIKAIEAQLANLANLKNE